MRPNLFFLFLFSTFLLKNVCSQELDEFKIKRKEVFEFTQAPKLDKDGDNYTISFSVKDYCDVTIVIENSSGKILRHLASGVLGPKPPKQFIANSLDQKVIWDGKNDEGKYVDTISDCRVRVSLGLKPVFEKRLYSSPYKRISNNAPILAVDESGVYTFEGQGLEYVKHYDHDGNYVKTVYPFPANKIKDVKGLKLFKSLKDGKMYPQKLGYNQATFLTSGTSAIDASQNTHAGGYAATAMAVKNGHIALAYDTLNRLGTDGSTKGLELNGPTVGITIPWRQNKRLIGPSSIAFSPDSKYLYITGFVYKVDFFESYGDCFHVVYKMEYGKNEEPKIFVGKKENDKGIGTDNNSFCVPTSVDTDKKGRVYISDFGNNRIQVYEENGTFLKSIPTPFPAKVFIDPKTQEIISFSNKIIGASSFVQKSKNLNISGMESTMANLGTFENPKESKPEPVPIAGGSAAGGRDQGSGGQVYEVIYNSFSKNPAIWISSRKPTGSLEEFAWGGQGNFSGWAGRGIKIVEKRDNKWVGVVDFGKRAEEDVKQVRPPSFANQRLHFNPSDGCLYVAEDNSFDKSSNILVKINPDTSEITLVPIPFDAAEDIVFWYNDLAFLRTDYTVMRFNSKIWKEIPWDYGNEFDKVFFQTFHAPERWVPAVAGLPIPGERPVHWQLGGMNINAKGHLAVVCYIRPNPVKPESLRPGEKSATYKFQYKPHIFPGKFGHYVVNIYDSYGKMIKDDAFPGLHGADGLGIDMNDDLYVLLRNTRYVSEKDKFLEYTKTLVKVTPGKAKVVGTSQAEIPLPPDEIPKRNPDIIAHGVKSWVENADWFYGGVGHGGQGACACWHGGFAFDLLGRSFVSEANQYQVAVLDSSGNLILRVGQYSNADSYGAKSPVPLGGNEIGIMAAHYVGVESDKRMFIADTGNQRILSVKLNYEVDATIPLQPK